MLIVDKNCSKETRTHIPPDYTECDLCQDLLKKEQELFFCQVPYFFILFRIEANS